MNTRSKIKAKCKKVEDLLLNKNARYGDASLEPVNIFSKCNSVTSIKARIDDKLKRIQTSGPIDDTEDTLIDLTGYLILLMIAKDNESHNIQKRIRQEESTPHSAGDRTSTHPVGEVVYSSI